MNQNYKRILSELHHIQQENKMKYNQAGEIDKGRKDRKRGKPFQLCIAFSYVRLVPISSRFRLRQRQKQ